MLSDLLIQSGLSRPGCHQVDELLVEASWNTRSLSCSLHFQCLVCLTPPLCSPSLSDILLCVCWMQAPRSLLSHLLHSAWCSRTADPSQEPNQSLWLTGCLLNSLKALMVYWLNLSSIFLNSENQLKNSFTGQQWKNKEHRPMDMGRGEERVRCMERITLRKNYITICKIDSQWEFAVWLRKLKQGFCINLEGWDGEKDGREVQKGGDMCIPMADSCWGFL